jgi:ribosomal protein S6
MPPADGMARDIRELQERVRLLERALRRLLVYLEADYEDAMEQEKARKQAMDALERCGA